RQEAPAILQAIHERLIALESGRISWLGLPKSPLGKASSYNLGQWTALQRSLEEGVYEIDNNRVEDAIRPTCIGTKNWLFIGHPDAGWRSAVIYSLLITGRRYGLDPVAGLTDVLRRIPQATNPTVAELLPWNWKPAKA
ncbi:MAG: transposase, partial [Pedosphaera sp.]|nr:transposase [Pedosphaera sp.]